MPSVRPEHDDSFWSELAERHWRRTRWRKGMAEDATCAAYQTPIHRAGTYYRRPAYTDGTLWLSQQAYDDLRRWMNESANRQSSPDR